MRVNYLIATWAGARYNPSKDYLKIHLKRLFELHHNLDQITVIRPLGSDNDDFYDVGEEMLSKIVILNRPDNDRSYGQFIYAYEQYRDQFDYYIICEDDYVPNIDNFDQILVGLINKKNVDYLCGKWGTQCRQDPPRCIMNQGIVRSSAFKTMLERCSPKFPKMGPEDGTEQQLFADYFTNNGLNIADYSDEYSVPYWTKTLTYFTKNRSWDTIFVPYQCLSKDTSPHFLSHVQRSSTRTEDEFNIIDPAVNLYPSSDRDVIIGSYKIIKENNVPFIQCDVSPELYITMLERITWYHRDQYLFLKINKNCVDYTTLINSHWIEVNEIDGYAIMHKDHNHW